MQAGHQRYCLMHYQITYSAIELVSHAVYLLLDFFVLLFFFLQLFFLSSYLLESPFLAIYKLLGLCGRCLLGLGLFRVVDQDHKYEANFILLGHTVT